MATSLGKNEKPDSNARHKNAGHSGLSLVDKIPRNSGTEFHPEWIEDIRINLSAVERRIASLGARRSVKKQWQAAWLLKAI